MVSAQEAVATRIGVEVLRKGGNAIDAAVAVGFALAVTLPRAGNLGGGGFMIVHEAKTGQTHAIDYRETAPAGATRNMFLDENGEYDRRKAVGTHFFGGCAGDGRRTSDGIGAIWNNVTRRAHPTGAAVGTWGSW